MAELVTRNDLDTSIAAVRRDLDSLRRELEAKIDAQTLRLTVRLGGILVAGIAVLGAIQRLH